MTDKQPPLLPVTLRTEMPQQVIVILYLMVSAHFTVFNYLLKTGPAACADTWLCCVLLINSPTHVTGP